MDYNFNYIKDMRQKCDDTSYEFFTITNTIDARVSERTNSGLFHIVPILYTMTFAFGSLVFAYQLLLNDIST